MTQKELDTVARELELLEAHFESGRRRAKSLAKRLRQLSADEEISGDALTADQLAELDAQRDRVIAAARRKNKKP